MSNFRLFKPAGETMDVTALEITGWRSTRRDMRLTQPPGSNQSFIIGRSTRKVTPFLLRLLVDEDSEGEARTKFAIITAFARDAVMLGRIDSGTLDVDSLERLIGYGKSLARITPEPLHLGADSWSVLVELRPYTPTYSVQAHELQTPDSQTLETPDGLMLVTFT